ncbi:MAG: UDP-2,3-diacylglucosamine diphosphatase [Petrimonas sp.]|jgi:UDP-2,3-diacylglucosamine hydrolase
MNKKVYFVSDAHLGSKMHTDSVKSERKLCRWLDFACQDAQAIYLLGDIFDYWFEYKTVVPRGFTRLLGKLSEITDSGIDVHFFIGNHDIWLTDYLQNECGLNIHRKPLITEIFGKKFFIAHGDGLDDDSKSFRLLRKIFHNKFLRKCFSAIHPRWTIPLAHAWSNKSRETGEINDFLGEDNEYLIQFAKQEIKRTPDIDYFVFGHRHILLDFPLNEKSHVINIGDWIQLFSYAVFDGTEMKLKKFLKM